MGRLDRRGFVVAALASSAIATVPPALAASEAFAGFEQVVDLARRRASAPYEQRRLEPRGAFADLDYDSYRAVRVRPERRLWQDLARGFTVDLLPPGLIFLDPVQIAVVEDGVARPLPFDTSVFSFDAPYFEFPDGMAPPVEDMAWSGFRLRYRLNDPEVDDEVAVFQGASYFRSIGRDQVFGLSARGLALRTAAAEGEEFPVFTDFWLHRPPEQASEMTIHAILDSPSVAGAYEFVVRPGAETTMDVRTALFPRVEIEQVAIAPLTSMYWFGPRNRVDDFRPAVHDSSGLQMITGRGERLWRPLTNPRELQVSYFLDSDPRGFGLAQRPREFAQFQDAEARYDRRPSAWVEPRGTWGPGAVVLVEIPTDDEFHDNVVAFWRPEAPLLPGAEWSSAYRLYWGDQPPDYPSLARVVATREGRAVNAPDRRVIVVDFALGERSFDGLTPRASASPGELTAVDFRRLPHDFGARVALEFVPPSSRLSELRLVLVDAEGASASETWMIRWTE